MAESSKEDAWRAAEEARQKLHKQQRARAKLLTFERTVLPGKDLPCVCSWPGGAWEALVNSSRNGETSAAVVFLPQDSEKFGKHDVIPASENLEGECWCTPLYGEPKPWGCHWWTCWIANIELAVREGCRLQVFFFEGSLHQGKVDSAVPACIGCRVKDSEWTEDPVRVQDVRDSRL